MSTNVKNYVLGLTTFTMCYSQFKIQLISIHYSYHSLLFWGKLNMLVNRNSIWKIISKQCSFFHIVTDFMVLSPLNWSNNIKDSGMHFTLKQDTPSFACSPTNCFAMPVLPQNANPLQCMFTHKIHCNSCSPTKCKSFALHVHPQNPLQFLFSNKMQILCNACSPTKSFAMPVLPQNANPLQYMFAHKILCVHVLPQTPLQCTFSHKIQILCNAFSPTKCKSFATHVLQQNAEFLALHVLFQNAEFFTIHILPQNVNPVQCMFSHKCKSSAMYILPQNPSQRMSSYKILCNA